ncbi:MAG: hypothetical protein ACM3NH_01745 [Candidatus Saccharibacteria bacterium]
MPCIVVLRVDGKIELGCAGVPRTQAEQWAESLRTLARGRNISFTTEVVEDVERLPSPADTIGWLLEMKQVKA